MKKQIEEIYNDLSTAGWNIFNSPQEKLEVAEHLAKLNYRKESDVVSEVINEINKNLELKDFHSNDIATGYLWAICDTRKLLLEVKKKYYESKGVDNA